MTYNSYTSSLPRRTQTRPRMTSDVFRPPSTPQDTSTPLAQSQHGSNGDFHLTSRKRPRTDGPDASFETPYAASGFSPWGNNHSNPSTAQSSSFVSPPPLANERYRLSGGLDTPAQSTAVLDEDLGLESNHDYRTTWHNGNGNDESVNFNAVTRERDSALHTWKAEGDQASNWSRIVLDVVGTVAGKVWDFCRTSAFQGFTAGGGRPFPFASQSGAKEERTDAWSEREVSASNMDSHAQNGLHDGKEQFYDCISPEDTDWRPAKRLHTGQGNGWVMINHHDRASPTQEAAAFHSRPGHSPIHRSLLPRPSSTKPTTTRLPRPSTTTTSNHNSLPRNGTRSPSTPTKRLASFAQPRSPASTSQSSPSPKRRIPVRQQEDWEGDDGMGKLNRQLQAMIREGQAALAAGVVDDEGAGVADEGYAEGSKGIGKGW